MVHSGILQGLMCGKCRTTEIAEFELNCESHQSTVLLAWKRGAKAPHSIVSLLFVGTVCGEYFAEINGMRVAVVPLLLLGIIEPRTQLLRKLA